MLAHRPLFVCGVYASGGFTGRWKYASMSLSMSLSLREYAARFNRTLRAIALAADVDTGDIYAIADGKAGWTGDTAARIQKATDGHVTANDLLRVRQTYLAEQERIKRSRARAKSQKKNRGSVTEEAA